jgi:hypothetical protein
MRCALVWNYTYTHPFLSPLPSSFHPSLSAGMPAERVTRTISSLARANGVPSDLTAALHGTIRTYALQG